MSRLIVKNLPPSVNIEEFKKHFSERGNITDAKLVHKDGTFRRFGFIGYENGDAATDACNFFNGTYYKQYKIIVEVCEAFGKGEKPLSWREKNKQWREKERQEKMLEKEEKAKMKKEIKAAKKEKKKKLSIKEQLLEQYKDDPGFGDFLKLKDKDAEEETKEAEVDSEQDEGIGIEDGTDHGGTEEKEDEEGDSEEEGESKEKLANKSVSDLDYLNSLKSGVRAVKGADTKKVVKEKEKLHTVIIRTKNMCKTGKRTFTKQNIKAFLKPIKFKSLRIPRGCRLVAYVGFKTEKQMNQALQKDKSFIDGARVQVVKCEEVDNNTNNEHIDLPWYTAQEKLKKAEPVTDTGSLFIRNLWYSVTEEDLRELLEKYGQITELNLPICKYRRRAKGFAQVTYMFPEHAVKAMTELDGTTFKGRILHVLPAIVKEEEEATTEGSSFKEKQQKEKKATAGAGHNWNTLFIGSGAVVDLMSEKYNRSKQEILNSEGKQSVAVNLALGETQIVDETKRFLEDSGISLDAFTTSNIKRSNTVILVKNLPAKTTAQELSQLFCRYGELGRVVLPPAGVTGVVEYLDPSEARKGFKNLAYSKFKYLPLYLEWAPLNVFRSEFSGTSIKPGSEDATSTERESEDAEGRNPVQPDAQPEPDTTIFVKNLDFGTTEDVLKQYFEKIGQVHSVVIAKRNGLSQGYGFVQFMKRSDAHKSIRNMQNSVLEGHTIEIKLSEKTLVAMPKSSRMIQRAGEQTSSKILVKNIPFQATQKEVRQLFATFGELRFVRLPSKMNSQEHRGFGFVEFVTREDAKKAFEALRLSTHLYDRRLVLEWAKDDESVEELRKRTAEKFLASGPARKRTKVVMDPVAHENSDED